MNKIAINCNGFTKDQKKYVQEAFFRMGCWWETPGYHHLSAGSYGAFNGILSALVSCDKVAIQDAFPSHKFLTFNELMELASCPWRMMNNSTIGPDIKIPPNDEHIHGIEIYGRTIPPDDYIKSLGADNQVASLIDLIGGASYLLTVDGNELPFEFAYTSSTGYFIDKSNPAGSFYHRRDLNKTFTAKLVESSKLTPVECKPTKTDRTKPRNKYDREIVPGVFVDVYDVLGAFKTDSPAVDHAVKKLLAPGKRGHKDRVTDLKEAIASIESEIAKINEWSN